MISTVPRFAHERYAALRSDPAIGRWYARLETLNSRFIALLSAWQQMGSDERQLRKALEVVDALCTALDELLPLLPRYVEYQRPGAAGARPRLLEIPRQPATSR